MDTPAEKTAANFRSAAEQKLSPCPKCGAIDWEHHNVWSWRCRPCRRQYQRDRCRATKSAGKSTETPADTSAGKSVGKSVTDKAMRARLKELEQWFAQERQDERRAAREKAKLEREILEIEKARVMAGLLRYQRPREESMIGRAREIIAKGFQFYAMRRHRDTGGTAQDLAALTATRNWLLSVLNHPLLIL